MKVILNICKFKIYKIEMVNFEILAAKSKKMNFNSYLEFQAENSDKIEFDYSKRRSS